VRKEKRREKKDEKRMPTVMIIALNATVAFSAMDGSGGSINMARF